MYKLLSLILLIAVVNAKQMTPEMMMETSSMPMERMTETTMPMEEMTSTMPKETTTMKMKEDEEELPCLNRAIGATLPHPGDPHKFLRCVSHDTLWIESCPSNLVYNEWLSLCDWNNEKPTTAAPTTRRPFVRRPIISATGARMIKGKEWFKQLTSTWAPETTTMMPLEITTPEIISTGMNAGKVALPKDTMDKIKGMIKGSIEETTPLMITPETATAFIEKDGMWFEKKDTPIMPMNPGMQMKPIKKPLMPIQDATTMMPMEETTMPMEETTMKSNIPIKTPAETEKMIIENVEGSKKVVKPVVEMGKDAVKVLLSKETINKIQKLIKKTV